MPRRSSRGSGPRPSGLKRKPTATSSRTASSKTGNGSVPKDAEAEVSSIDIASLTLDIPLIPFAPKRRAARTPFHFLSLPSELRIKIYQYFFNDIDKTLDLAPDNYKRIHKKLGLLRVCRQVHEEASFYFYGFRTFRIFPTYPGRYFKSKKPLLARMKPRSRQDIRALELRLGPGWNAPPRGWVINPALGLQDCVNVSTLRVFVECDPSDAIFQEFRRAEGFYENFSRDLLGDLLDKLPSVTTVEFDGWASVRKIGGMMRGLLEVAENKKRAISWGPERGWTDDMHEDDEVYKPVQWLNKPRDLPPGYGGYDVLAHAWDG